MDLNSLRSEILGAAVVEFGRHRKAVLITPEDIQRNNRSPEYQLVAEYDSEKSGYWVWVEPVPKRERTTKLVPYYGDPGDEHHE